MNLIIPLKYHLRNNWINSVHEKAIFQGVNDEIY